MPNDTATRRFVWIVGVHALLFAVATACTLPASGASPFAANGWSSACYIVWWAIVEAQVSLLQIHAAFGASPLMIRLAVLTAGFALSAFRQLWWIGLYWWAVPSGAFSPNLTSLLLSMASQATIGFGAPSIALFCLRSRIGVIRQASPLAARGGKRLSLRSLLIWTTAAAAMAGGFRLVADFTGNELTAAVFLLTLITETASIVGVVVMVFSAKRRWAGWLIWAGAVATHGLMTTYQTGASVSQIALQAGGIGLLVLAITYTTLWPLRRVGYRLTAA